MTTDLLTEFTPAAMARANRKNLLAMINMMERDPQGAVWRSEGVTGRYLPIPNPIFNTVVSTRPPRADERATIEEVVRFFKARGRDLFTWWWDPDVDGTGWEAHLAGAGLHPDFDTPGMGLALESLPDPLPLPEGVRISIVEEQEALETWLRIFLAGFELPPDWLESFRSLMASVGLDLPVRNYIGYLDNQPVAISTLFLSEGVAGIYNVATLPEARGRGLGTAVTLATLQDAYKLGYRVATLQSSKEGLNVYRRLGFQTVCQMEQFLWEDG